jgi:molybdate transport system substrate-binding protein
MHWPGRTAKLAIVLRSIAGFRVKTLAVLLLGSCIAGQAHAGPARADTVTVFAAISLSEALQEVARQYEAQGGGTVRFSFAATGALARQIESGAPADLFISADEVWMDYLQARHLLQDGTRVNVACNALVLVARAAVASDVDIATGAPLLRALGGGRLAIADPDSVPAGRYARQALESLGVWEAVALRLARAENVRAALAFVSRGEAPLGIVYATDAVVDPRVRVVARFPPGSHQPIVLPAAMTAHAANASAAFLAFLRGVEGQAVLRRHGFLPP